MKLLLTSLFIITPIISMEKITSVHFLLRQGSGGQARLKNLELYHNHDGYHAKIDNHLMPIKSHNVDKLLREIKTQEQLHDFQQRGCIWARENDHDEITLESQIRMTGGGIGLATAAYWGIKAVGYAGISILGAAVAGWFKKDAPNSNMATYVAASGTSQLAKAAIPGLGASIPGAMITGAVIYSGQEENAAHGVAGVIVSAGGVAPALAGIEAAANAAYFALLPLPTW